MNSQQPGDYQAKTENGGFSQKGLVKSRLAEKKENRKTFTFTRSPRPNRDLQLDVDLYVCISFVSIAMARRETSFISGIDDGQTPQFG